MLHCNMNDRLNLQLGLDDLLADLRHARRSGDLGRLALISYCEVRRWARAAGEADLARRASEFVSAHPAASREIFLEQIDTLIFELDRLQRWYAAPASSRPAGLDDGSRHGTGTGAG